MPTQPEGEEVERLLRGGLFATGDFASGPAQGGALPPGLRVVRGEAAEYELVAPLGRGGMGAVFRARRGDGEEVAVKLLHAAGAEALARFERERRLQASVGLEAGFVPVLDHGLAGRTPFLVMPLAEGGTLEERLRGGPLPVEEALALGRALAGALARAHARGVVHRDLKPGNVLYLRGAPCVADLGLAKHFRLDVTGASASAALSGPDQARGTWCYMPPEQVQDARAVDARADVFALGAILYEALAGRRAYDGPTPLEVAARMDRGDLEPLRRVRPEVPPWLAAVVEGALAPDPARRFADGAALLRALEGAPADAAAPPAAGARGRRAFQALLLVALVAAAALLWPRPAGSPPAAAPSPAAQPPSARDEDEDDGPSGVTPAPVTSADPVAGAALPEPVLRVPCPRDAAERGGGANMWARAWFVDDRHLLTHARHAQRFELWDVVERRLVGGVTLPRGTSGHAAAVWRGQGVARVLVGFVDSVLAADVIAVDGRLLLDDARALWTVPAGARYLGRQRPDVLALAARPDGFAVGGEWDAAFLVDPAGALQGRVPAPEGTRALAFAGADGRTLLVGRGTKDGRPGRLSAWDVRAPGAPRQLEPTNDLTAGTPVHIACDPRDPGRFAVALDVPPGKDETTVLLGGLDGARRGLGHAESIGRGVAFRPGELLGLARAGPDALRAWRLAPPGRGPDEDDVEPAWSAGFGRAHASWLAASPDGRLVAVGFIGGTVTVWRVADLAGR